MDTKIEEIECAELATVSAKYSILLENFDTQSLCDNNGTPYKEVNKAFKELRLMTYELRVAIQKSLSIAKEPVIKDAKYLWINDSQKKQEVINYLNEGLILLNKNFQDCLDYSKATDKDETKIETIKRNLQTELKPFIESCMKSELSVVQKVGRVLAIVGGLTLLAVGAITFAPGLAASLALFGLSSQVVTAGAAVTGAASLIAGIGFLAGGSRNKYLVPPSSSENKATKSETTSQEAQGQDKFAKESQPEAATQQMP